MTVSTAFDIVRSLGDFYVAVFYSGTDRERWTILGNFRQ